jgi:histidine triad (HIT) family protein
MSDTIFSKIINREIPAEIVYETENVLAFKDIQPQAPVHILVIPKKPLKDLSAADKEDQALLGELMLSVGEIAKQQNLQSYRVVQNNGSSAGQSVFHLHLHLMSGRSFGWPPG